MMNKYKTNQKVWIFNGEFEQQETVVGFADDIQEYELSDGNFYEEKELYKSKKSCLDDN